MVQATGAFGRNTAALIGGKPGHVSEIWGGSAPSVPLAEGPIPQTASPATTLGQFQQQAQHQQERGVLEQLGVLPTGGRDYTAFEAAAQEQIQRAQMRIQAEQAQVAQGLTAYRQQTEALRLQLDAELAELARQRAGHLAQLEASFAQGLALTRNPFATIGGGPTLLPPSGV